MPSKRDPRTRGRPPPDKPTVVFKKEKQALERHLKNAKVVLEPISREYFFAKTKPKPPPATQLSSDQLSAYLMARKKADSLLSSPGYLSWVGCGSGRLLHQALQPIREARTVPKIKDIWKQKYIAEVEKQEREKAMQADKQVQTDAQQDKHEEQEKQPISHQEHNYSKPSVEAEKKIAEENETMTNEELIANIDSLLYDSDSEADKQREDQLTSSRQEIEEDGSEDDLMINEEEENGESSSSSSPPSSSSSSPSPSTSETPLEKLSKALALNSSLDQLVNFLRDCEETVNGPAGETRMERRERRKRKERRRPWTDEDEAEKERANQLSQIFFRRYQITGDDKDYDIAESNLSRYLEMDKEKRQRDC